MAVPPVDPRRPKPFLFRAAAAFARSRPGLWFASHVARRLDPILLRISGGRLATFPMAPNILMTVPGRKSGEPKTATLLYFTEGEEVVLMASHFGRTTHPQWYLNVKAHPEVTLSVRGQAHRYVARETEGEERDRLYGLAKELYAGWSDYEITAGDRLIPVLALRPLE
jgi:deazaflavin-dependent oxidoreductase (nitroreductase family)